MDHAILRSLLDVWSAQRRDLRQRSAILRRCSGGSATCSYRSHQCQALHSCSVPHILGTLTQEAVIELFGQ